MGKMQAASFLLMVATVSCFMVQSTNALIHVVGGSFGWDVPPRKDFYRLWAHRRTFGIGDQLVFPYTPGAEDVYQVGKEDFDKCGDDHVISQWMLGPTVVPLIVPGNYYFYSAVGTHCEMGQKLHIVVGNAPGSDGINWHVAVNKLPFIGKPTRKLLASSPALALGSEASLS